MMINMIAYFPNEYGTSSHSHASVRCGRGRNRAETAAIASAICVTVNRERSARRQEEKGKSGGREHAEIVFYAAACQRPLVG